MLTTFFLPMKGSNGMIDTEKYKERLLDKKVISCEVKDAFQRALDDCPAMETLDDVSVYTSGLNAGLSKCKRAN